MRAPGRTRISPLVWSPNLIADALDFFSAFASCAQDWKFWVGILAVVSVATALLGHTPSDNQAFSV